MPGFLNRDPFPILAVVVIVVALALTAATIDTIQTTTAGEGPLEGPGQPQPGQGGDGPDLNRSAGEAVNETPTGRLYTTNVIPLTMCIRFLQTPLGLIALLLGYVGFLYVISRQYGGARASLTGYITAPAVFILYFVVTQCPTIPNYGNPLVNSALTQPAGGGLDTIPVPPELLALVFGVLFLAGIGMLFLATGSEEVIEPPEEEPPEPDVTEFARAAGRAAERIEQHNADINNAVYQAWYEMTTLLPVENRETMTPGEFGEAATDAGMASEDVDELTWLFNEVRYGGLEADEDREQRAVDVLRHIEEEYGSEGPADGEDTPEEDTPGNQEDGDEEE